MKDYDFASIEKKWRARWGEIGLFRTDLSRAEKKFYCLMMFPYPSAALHVGHGRNYIIGDAVARYHMMKGYNVLAPMGWDSFGLPAENAAIKSGVHPADSTARNIATMHRQMGEWGVGYDWDREISACSPEYYRWTQWLFLHFFDRGLAYKKKALVNWCPSCSTSLANEQVIDGKCERCRSTVEKKNLEQWFFRITAYAQRLLDDLKTLDGWPERVKTMQENWIGRSEGAEVDFRIKGHRRALRIFTTRPDTLWGATFMVMAPEHPLLDEIASPEQRGKILSYREEVGRESEIERAAVDKEKTGVFTGAWAVNPVNGEEIPIWAADYVMMTYGTGAIMAVPAHDRRDFDFARTHGLSVRVVIAPPGWDGGELSAAYEDVDAGTMVASGVFDGTPAREGKGKVTEWLAEKKLGRAVVHYRLRDWLLSRQRYWGAPIPIVYCEECGAVPVPVRDLPVLLPREVNFVPTGQSPLALSEEFKRTTCPECGGAAVRETDTMDTFVDSSWYFLRYLTPRDNTQPFDTDLCNLWLPVDQYIGGVEHATMHLIYARFFTKVLFDSGLLGFSEPFRKLFTQGMICKEAYYSQGKGYLSPDQVRFENGKAVDAASGAPVEARLEKMSKSRLNVVPPDRLIAEHGADAVRLYTLFIGPPEKDAEWNDQAMEGASRFLKRLWKKVQETAPALAGLDRTPVDRSALNAAEKALFRKTHQTIDKVSRDMEGAFHFNTAIASVMELVNEAYSTTPEAGRATGLKVMREALEAAVLCLAPFVPHVCEELWRDLGHAESVFRSAWPEADRSALIAEEVELAVQVNGKVRGRVTVPADLDEESVRERALSDERVKPFLEGAVAKVVVVPGRLVNIVVRPRA